MADTGTRISPDLQASLLCDDVRQERNGKFIVIGIFDMIGMPSFPAAFQRVCVLNRWCSGTGEFRQRSRLLKADGLSALVEGKDVPVRLPHGEATATCVEYFLNVRFEAEGTHWVEILLDDDLRLRYPLKVQLVKRAGAAPPPPAPA